LSFLASSISCTWNIVRKWDLGWLISGPMHLPVNEGSLLRSISIKPFFPLWRGQIARSLFLDYSLGSKKGLVTFPRSLGFRSQGLQVGLLVPWCYQ
jgi:hypothetical protein